MSVKSFFVGLIATGVLVAMPVERSSAALPVIDIASIQQLIMQILYWEQQISGMSNQLKQLKETHSALTGSRGMQNLLNVTPQMRNYLPPDWQSLMSVVQSNGGNYSGLSTKA